MYILLIELYILFKLNVYQPYNYHNLFDWKNICSTFCSLCIIFITYIETSFCILDTVDIITSHHSFAFSNSLITVMFPNSSVCHCHRALIRLALLIRMIKLNTILSHNLWSIFSITKIFSLDSLFAHLNPFDNHTA